MSLYEDLGIPPNATPEEIEAAGRRKVKATHPDAGGDPAAFDRTMKALTILRDPLRRANYDQTGDASAVNPESLIEANAMTLLGSHLMQLVQGGHDYRFLNVVAAIRQALTQEEANGKQQLAEIARSTERFEAFAKRLSRKTEGPNRLSELLLNQIRDLNIRKGNVDLMLKTVAKAKEMAAEYVYAVDTPQQAQSVQWVQLTARGPGGFFGSTTG